MMQLTRIAYAISIITVCKSVWLTTTEQSDEESCDFKGDMCSLSQKCLRKYAGYSPHSKECNSLVHTPVYKKDVPKEFRISAGRDNDSYYLQSDFKVAIVKIFNNTISYEKDCCNLLNDNDSCALKWAGPDTTHSVIAPITSHDGSSQYCYFDLFYRDGVYPKWCSAVVRTAPCLLFKDGILGVNETFTAISSIGWPSRVDTDYCIFYVPKDYVINVGPGLLDADLAYANRSKLIDDGYSVTSKDFETKCHEIHGRETFNLKKYLAAKEKSGVVACAFIKIKIYRETYDPTPVCYIGPTSDEGKMTIVIASAIPILCCLIIALAVFVIYKRCKQMSKVHKSGRRNVIDQISSMHEKRGLNYSLGRPGKAKLQENSRSVKDSSGRYVLFFPNPSTSSYASSVETETEVFKIVPIPIKYDEEKGENNCCDELQNISVHPNSVLINDGNDMPKNAAIVDMIYYEKELIHDDSVFDCQDAEDYVKKMSNNSDQNLNSKGLSVPSMGLYYDKDALNSNISSTTFPTKIA